MSAFRFPYGLTEVDYAAFLSHWTFDKIGPGPSTVEPSQAPLQLNSRAIFKGFRLLLTLDEHFLAWTRRQLCPFASPW
jgi:hypothetical protein